MNAPTPAKADETTDLREALAKCLAIQDGWSDPDALWTDNLGMISRGQSGDPVWLLYTEEADVLISGPLAQREAAHAAEIQAREAAVEMNALEVVSLGLPESAKWLLASKDQWQRRAIDAGVRAGRLAADIDAVLTEACRPSVILLMAGEMTAQERRTAQAVANGIASKVRAALPEAITPKETSDG